MNYKYFLRSPRLVRTCLVAMGEMGEKGSRFTAPVASMSFLYKPYWFEENNKPFYKTEIRLENLWEGVTRPHYVAFTDTRKKHKLEIGNPVYIFESKSEECPFWWLDENDYPHRIFIGTIEAFV